MILALVISGKASERSQTVDRYAACELLQLMVDRQTEQAPFQYTSRPVMKVYTE